MRATGSVFATGPDKEKILDEIIRINQYETRQLELEVAKLKVEIPNITLEQMEVVNQLIRNTIKYLLKHRNASLPNVLEQKIKLLDPTSRQFVNQNKDAVLDIAEIMNTEKTQIIIAGYPPFLKDLAVYIKTKGYALSDFSIISIVGGQAISEAMRDILIKDGFNDIYSSYGASDLDVNLASETDDEIVIRKAIEQNPGLARELYGVNKGLPMVFHYDPMNIHVECNNNESDKDDLIFTVARADRSSPRVRYNLGDKGRVYASSDVNALLAKYGIFHKPKTPLPLMFIWGRDSTVVFNGANLAFTELERAVTDVDANSEILKKAFYSYHDDEGNDKLEVWLELNDGIDLYNEGAMQEFTHNLISKLVDMNQDFRYQIEHLTDGAALPLVRFFKRGQSPISEAGGHRKQVLVFQKENLPEDYVFPGDNQCRGISLPMNKKLLINTQAPVAAMN
jgi:phenylacetate-coenzyme A ligase PaaK-like adenylate-forming protein